MASLHRKTAFRHTRVRRIGVEMEHRPQTIRLFHNPQIEIGDTLGTSIHTHPIA
jgi:hypothetical protein